MGILVVVALLFVVNPELRAVLLLIDAIGIDIVFVFVGLQLRGHLAVFQSWVVAPCWRLLTACGLSGSLWPPARLSRSLARLLLNIVSSPPLMLGLAVFGIVLHWPLLLLGLATFGMGSRAFLGWARSFVHLAEENCRGLAPETLAQSIH